MRETEPYVVDPLSAIVASPANNIYALGINKYEGRLMVYSGTECPNEELDNAGRGVAISREKSAATGFVAYDHSNRGWWKVAKVRNRTVEGYCQKMRLKRSALVLYPELNRRVSNV